VADANAPSGASGAVSVRGFKPAQQFEELRAFGFIDGT